MIKIIMKSHRIRKQALVDKAVRDVLHGYSDAFGDPNAPPITGGHDVYMRRNCPKCGACSWTPSHQELCDPCMSLILMEQELNHVMFRKERELRLRELEERLAE